MSWGCFLSLNKSSLNQKKSSQDLKDEWNDLSNISLFQKIRAWSWIVFFQFKRHFFPDFKLLRSNYICNIKDIIGTCRCDLSNVIYFIYACLVLWCACIVWYVLLLTRKHGVIAYIHSSWMFACQRKLLEYCFIISSISDSLGW